MARNVCIYGGSLQNIYSLEDNTDPEQGKKIGWIDKIQDVLFSNIAVTVTLCHKKRDI